MDKNMKAFLGMISWSEGTSQIPGGDNGYRVLVGSTIKVPKLFPSYHDHPRIKVNLGNGLFSTAAGRYQILARIFDAYRKILGLHDFSPAAQDLVAQKLISERYADILIEQGDIVGAIRILKKIWASFPGSGYGQKGGHTMDELIDKYLEFGGTIGSYR